MKGPALAVFCSLERGGGCGHQGLVLRRSCRFLMNRALIMAPPTVQVSAGGAGTLGATEGGGSFADPSSNKI